MPVGGLAPPPLEEEERRATESGQGVVFILEGAQLETAQVGKASDAPPRRPLRRRLLHALLRAARTERVLSSRLQSLRRAHN